MEETLKQIAASLERIDQRLAAMAAVICKPQVTISVNNDGVDLDKITNHVASELSRAIERSSAFH